MNQITVYKDGRSMVINDADGALKAIRTSGWTDRIPQGWEEPDVVVEDTIDSLRKQVADLTTKLEERSTQIDPNPPQPIPAKRGRKKKGESD